MIYTPRLHLRDWTDADIDAWAEMNADPRVMEFFVEAMPRDRSIEVAERLRANLRRNGYGWFVLERNDVPGFAGTIAIDDIRWETPFEPRREIGWRLPVSSWGKGYATEGASAATRYAFDILKWPEIVAITSRLNARSMRVMEKIGMTRDMNGDFDHPRVPPGHRIRPHVLYRKSNEGESLGGSLS